MNSAAAPPVALKRTPAAYHCPPSALAQMTVTVPALLMLGECAIAPARFVELSFSSSMAVHPLGTVWSTLWLRVLITLSATPSVVVAVMSALIVTLFLGGWSPGVPLPEGALGTWISAAVFTVKILTVLFIYIWVRWTLPRFRYDQLMKLGWKGLVPIAMANIVVTSILTALWDALTGGPA